MTSQLSSDLSRFFLRETTLAAIDAIEISPLMTNEMKWAAWLAFWAILTGRKPEALPDPRQGHPDCAHLFPNEEK